MIEELGVNYLTLNLSAQITRKKQGILEYYRNSLFF